MTECHVHRGATFERSARQLIRKDPAFDTILKQAIYNISNDLVQGQRIPGVNGKPVFKLRLPYGNHGKRGGARFIYYRLEALVACLFVYSKNEIEDVQPGAILDALYDANLI